MICLLVTLTSCKKDDEFSGSADGFATGKIVDTRGKALANVDVTIENTLVGTAISYIGKTDASGNYKIKIGKVGTYHASAYFEKEYNGITYRLPLHPDNDEVFSNEGAVRNFIWKLSGKMPDQGYYGSNIEINSELGLYIPDEENIEYTLTPAGKLIDGSDGTVLKLHTGEANSDSYGKLLDIPIGRYTITASYLHNGSRQSLRLKKTLDSENYQNSLTIDFPETWYEGVAIMYNF